MGVSLHPQHQTEVDSLERTQRTIAKKIHVLSANKMICTVFWDAKGVIWQELGMSNISIIIDTEFLTDYR